MAESNNEVNIQYRKDDQRLKFRGQNFAFIIVVLGFALAVFFGYFLKSTAAAITSIIAGIMPLAISGVRSFLKN